MRLLDWVVVGLSVVAIVVYGIWKGRGTRSMEGYLLAGRSLPWYAVALSVMATQASAITFLSAPGQTYVDGMRYIQTYLGLPIAMVVISVTILPVYHRLKVFTAYEFLESRFDLKTRALAAFLFLIQRGLAAGLTIFAPALILSAILGWNLTYTNLIVGVLVIVYTTLGGSRAVSWTQFQQMLVITVGMIAAFFTVLHLLPDSVSLLDATRVAGSMGRLNVIDFDFDITNRYNIWTGLIGGCFLALSYFGTDQSQVQRYLAAESVDAARSSLLMSAYWKIPLQALVLMVGVLVFIYYQFTPPPLLFNPTHEAAVVAERGAAYDALQQEYASTFTLREQAARAAADATEDTDAGAAMQTFLAREADIQVIRGRALALAEEVTGESSLDTNYIIPRFVLYELPIGLTGLFIAGVLAAAMSSIAAELTALSTTSVIDFYRRWVKDDADDAHYLKVSRIATVFWGVFACSVAIYAATLGSLIEVVNRFGSFFYGSILGVFLLAMMPRANGAGSFFGLLVGMGVVAAVAFGAPDVSFLWHNVIGAVTVVTVGLVLGGRGGDQEA